MKDKRFWSLPLLLISCSSKALWRNTEVITRKIFIPLAPLRGERRAACRRKTVSNGRSFVRQTCKLDKSGRCRNLSTIFVWQMHSVTNITFYEQPKKVDWIQEQLIYQTHYLMKYDNLLTNDWSLLIRSLSPQSRKTLLRSNPEIFNLNKKLLHTRVHSCSLQSRWCYSPSKKCTED